MGHYLQAVHLHELQVFLESSMPVVDHYDKEGKVYKFKSDRSPEEIYSEVRQLFLDL